MTDCEPCAYFAEHHWIGPDRSHCFTCHRTWTSKTQAHCMTCHEHFATHLVADKHLRDGVHLDPATARTPRTKELIFEKREDAYGEVWGGAYGPDAFQFARRAFH